MNGVTAGTYCLGEVEFSVGFKPSEGELRNLVAQFSDRQVVIVDLGKEIDSSTEALVNSLGKKYLHVPIENWTSFYGDRSLVNEDEEIKRITTLDGRINQLSRLYEKEIKQFSRIHMFSDEEAPRAIATGIISVLHWAKVKPIEKIFAHLGWEKAPFIETGASHNFWERFHAYSFQRTPAMIYFYRVGYEKVLKFRLLEQAMQVSTDGPPK